MRSILFLIFWVWAVAGIAQSDVPAVSGVSTDTSFELRLSYASSIQLMRIERNGVLGPVMDSLVETHEALRVWAGDGRLVVAGAEGVLLDLAGMYWKRGEDCFARSVMPDVSGAMDEFYFHCDAAAPGWVVLRLEMRCPGFWIEFAGTVPDVRGVCNK